MTKSLAAAAAALMISASAAVAQQPPAKAPAKPAAEHHKADHKMDHGKDDHGASPWKELDAYHMLMMATWHPAKDKSDLAPTRAKIGEMVTSAKTLAASTAPKGCDAPKVKEAAAALTAHTQSVADMVAKKADDASLKAAMKDLHDKFEVIEEGCVAPKSAKH